MNHANHLCLAFKRVPVMYVSASTPGGVIKTHRKESMPHICLLEVGHPGKHRCGLTTSEIWLEYCYHEWKGKVKFLALENEFNKRKAFLLEQEAKQPLATMYLSFSDTDGWKGAVVIEAHGIVDAIQKCNDLEINPGGQVMAAFIHVPSPSGRIIPVEAMNRLLTLAECENVFGEMERARF